MTKLTTEITIEELQYRINAHENDLTQMWTADYFLNVQKELLALKQAAKNPVAWVATDSEDFPEYNSQNEFSAGCGAGTPLYAAPVLPKQPDVTLTDEGDKIIKAAEKLVRCKGRYHSEQNYRALAALFGVSVPDLPPLPSDEAPAQPVIAEQWRSFVTDADISALHRFVECCDDPESGGHDLEKDQVQRLEQIGALQRSGRISYITDFGDYLISVAPAQEGE